MKNINLLLLSRRFPVKLIPSKHLLIFNTSWRHLQHVFNVIIFRLPRCLEDVLKTSRETSWRRLRKRKIVMLKTSSRQFFKTSWTHVLKTSWRHVWTCCRQTRYLLGISVSNKSKYVSNNSIFHKSISDESKVNPKSLIRTQ